MLANKKRGLNVLKSGFVEQYLLILNQTMKFSTGLKAFAEDKMKLAKMTIFVFYRVENIVGKGHNADYQHFLLFQQYFQNAFTKGG